MTQKKSEAAEIGRRTVITALSGAAATLGVGSASAQEGNATANGSTSTTSTPEPESETITVDLGEVVSVADWSVEGGTFRLTMTADYPTSIKITDTGAVMEAMTEGSGATATQIPTRGYSLGEGETVVKFDAVAFDDAHAVTVASARGAALLRTDSVDAGRPSVEYQTAGAMVGGAALATGAYSFRRSREKLEESDEPEIERIG